MKKKTKPCKSARYGGFIVLSRQLLQECFLSTEQAVTGPVAFLIILYMSHYSHQGTLQRGESALTLDEWSRLFHWTRWATKRYFDKLLKEGELAEHYEGRKRILRLTRYEELCGKEAGHAPSKESKTDPPAPSRTDEEFERFFEHYYSVNRTLEPSEKHLARKEWGKLSPDERRTAMDNVYDYYLTMQDVRHAKKAYNYLRHKSFIL